VKPACDLLDVVVSFDLKGDDQGAHMDYSGSASHRHSLWCRCQMLKLYECSDTPLVIFKAGRQGVPRCVLEMGYQPWSGQNSGHASIREADSISWANDKDSFALEPQSGSLFHA
jgi:hypothetical protein